MTGVMSKISVIAKKKNFCQIPDECKASALSPKTAMTLGRSLHTNVPGSTWLVRLAVRHVLQIKTHGLHGLTVRSSLVFLPSRNRT